MQLLGGTAHPGGAHDQPHALGDIQVAHGLPDLLAILSLDTPGYPAGPGVVGHQHQIAPGQADKGGQGSALVAPLLLFHLDHHLLTLLDHLLDGGTPFHSGVGIEVAADDFLKGQKTMALGPVVHKGRLQAGLDTGDPSLVDVGFFLLPGGGLDIQVVEFLTVNQSHPQLLLLSCVDQHSFHCGIPLKCCARPRPVGLSPGSTRVGRENRWERAADKPISNQFASAPGRRAMGAQHGVALDKVRAERRLNPGSAPALKRF